MSNPWINKLYEMPRKDYRIVIGLMSGTSLDGLDISLSKINNYGIKTIVEPIQFETISYPDSIKEEIKNIFSKEIVDLKSVCLLNAFIVKYHGELVNTALKKWNYKNKDVDLIASHGQTIFHSPKRLRVNDKYNNATLQIGDGDHIALETQIITLSDFRQKHIAAGGEGAPLAVYGDYLLFRNSAENRIMLNIGGIANFTYLPADDTAESMFSTDVGPGNTIMDQFMFKHFNKACDYNSEFAKSGKVNQQLLNSLLKHPFFKQKLPKTTGPELFNLDYLEKAIADSGISNIDLNDQMATLNMFSAQAIASIITEFIDPHNKPIIYSSGGGIYNIQLIKNLKTLLPSHFFKDIKALGINPDEKEAILFALLANETVCGSYIKFGNTNSQPSVLMGKISLP
jgi:anhydro-N-acetylmuramic acid kinase